MLPTIAEHHTIILRLPSSAFKLITINPKATTCSIGKFGSFNANDLVGHAYGYTYEIQADKSLKILTAESLEKIEEEEVGNNEFIVDEQNQGLSHEEIRALRDSGDREALIEKLKQNNKSFELKTEYSKEKYTARKMAKFAPRFTTIPPTIFDVIDFLLDKDAEKILHVNQESMGYLLNTADVRPGGHYLVVDDVAGLLVSAVLERGANVTLIHDTEHPNIDSIKYFPQYDPETVLESGRVKALNWEQVMDKETVLAELESYITARQQSDNPRDVDRTRKRQQTRDAVEEFHKTDFDGCLVMSTYTPTSIVPPLLPRIAASRKLAVYSAHREPLLALRHAPLTELLAPCIAEVRAREYQVLQGRTRPVMTKRGEWGFVYHAIKVERLDGVTAVGKNQKGKEKRNADANTAKKAKAAATSGAGDEAAGAVKQVLISRDSTADDSEMMDGEGADTEEPEPSTKRIKV